MMNRKKISKQFRRESSKFIATTSSCRLFEEHTELLHLFEKFRELKTKEQQATSEELAEHANKVMETLDEGIRSLDELDVFFQYLHEVGASHTRIPGKQRTREL
jgi:neuroglobin